MGCVGTAALAAAKLPSFPMMKKTTIVLDQNKTRKASFKSQMWAFKASKILYTSKLHTICLFSDLDLPSVVNTDRQTDTLGRQVHFGNF
jgi:hypothetical protein